MITLPREIPFLEESSGKLDTRHPVTHVAQTVFKASSGTSSKGREVHEEDISQARGEGKHKT